mgnify:CR=1 FL=1
MKKYIATILVFLLLLALASCANEDVVLDDSQTYEITSDIHSLDIQINAADFKIKHGDAFSVESNLKYLSVSEKNGVLTIVDEAKSSSNYSNAILTLYVPNGIVFDDVYITTGAAKLTVDTLSANSLELKLGAGDVRFESLNASSNADIMLDSLFENEAALKAYATHPSHVAVADKYVRPYTATRTCMDYTI